MEINFPKPLTPEEVAEVTRTSKEDVEAELEAGHMPGFKIGNKWRILEGQLLAFMNCKLDSGKNGATESLVNNIPQTEWKQREPFDYKWPDGSIENYELAYEANVELSSRCHQFIIGYTNRKAAGMEDRRRVIIFLGNGRTIIPVVEFAGANDFAETRRLASVIKERNGRHVRSQWQLPPEYVGMPTVVYSDIVVGPYAANSLAVITNEDDRNTMLHHALIRARYKGWIRD